MRDALRSRGSPLDLLCVATCGRGQPRMNEPGGQPATPQAAQTVPGSNVPPPIQNSSIMNPALKTLTLDLAGLPGVHAWRSQRLQHRRTQRPPAALPDLVACLRRTDTADPRPDSRGGARQGLGQGMSRGPGDAAACREGSEMNPKVAGAGGPAPGVPTSASPESVVGLGQGRRSADSQTPGRATQGGVSGPAGASGAGQPPGAQGEGAAGGQGAAGLGDPESAPRRPCSGRGPGVPAAVLAGVHEWLGAQACGLAGARHRFPRQLWLHVSAH